MNEPLICGGYIITSRKIIESEIFKKPPLYLKVWIYLLSKAQYKDYKGLKRGELFTSIPEIQEACSYMVGYRKTKPSKSEVYKIIEWLRSTHESDHESNAKATMIETAKATHGMLVSICNYNIYQDSKNYESNNESDNERTAKELRKKPSANNINKERKEREEGKEDIYINIPTELLEPLKDFEEMRKKIKAPMTDKARTMLLNNLNKLSNGDNQKAIAILNQSTMNSWKGVFPLKEDKKVVEIKPANKFHNFEERTYTQNEIEEQIKRNSERKLKKLRGE